MVRVASGHQVSYSNCSEKHELKSQDIIKSANRIEYCPINRFYKDGRGIVYYYDDHDVLAHTLLCNWSKGKMHGKGYLYDVKKGSFVSILTFCDDFLVGEVDFCIDEYAHSIIDATDGSRWEGPCRDGKAYGRGMIYSESNNPCYFGWCVDDERCGFGTVYYDLPGEELVPSIEGYWFHDALYGPVEHFDYHGDHTNTSIMIAGKDIGEHLVYFPNDPLLLYSFVKIVQIESNYGTDEVSVFDMSSCTQLVELHIGSNCFPKVRGFMIKDLRFLRSVVIEKDSFTSCNRLDNNPWTEPNPRAIKINRQSLKVCNCPSLTEFYCEEGCFSSFLSFTMFDLPSLRTLRIGIVSEEEQFEQGSWSFFWCPTVHIRHFPSLETCEFGNYSFYFSYAFQIEGSYFQFLLE